MKPKNQNPVRSCIAFPVMLILLLSCYISRAREAAEEKAPDMFGVSAGGGYTFSHTDFEWTRTVPSPVACIGVHYFSLDFLSVNLDFQKGMMKGGAPLKDEESVKTGFENRYFALCLSFRFFPLALPESVGDDKVLKALSSFYVGTGLGYLNNDVRANHILSQTYGSQPRYQGSNLFIPLEFGVCFPVAKIRTGKLMVHVNLRTALCFSDYLDGYVPTVEANKHNDAFSTLTGGLVYRFGM